MKVHYINILLFALPLNILVYNQRNDKSTTHHTPKLSTNRLLCECELYAPVNNDNDSEMKRVMQQFEDRTSQRLRKYDERMQSKRMQCKDKCDKEIQKIILKDKLEKELTEKLSALQTDILKEAIPTCICKKSLADKTEKFCLNCGMNVGGGVTLSSGVLGGIGQVALNAWQPLALAAAKEAAEKAAIAAGKVAGDAYGKSAVIKALDYYEVDYLFPRIFESIRNIKNYTDVTNFSSQIVVEYKKIGAGSSINASKLNHFKESFGLWDPENGVSIGNPSTDIPSTINSVVGTTKTAAESKAAQVTAAKAPAFEKTYMDAVDATYMSSQTAITASIVAIVVIVLIMVIIYKILRYRRKKNEEKTPIHKTIKRINVMCLLCRC
ncbi:rifin [Plasmodium reichenowi]|uniref:Rifin n=1 Tax=Plasmodium reichenowi TaxID=5854 RepID=A0A060RM25_PLARE|nr:rifin [Plasmodium reichenowi]